MANENSFLLCVKKYFGFLADEFGYTFHENSYGSKKPWADGIVEYYSTKTTIRIGKDRNSFFVLLKPSGESEIAVQSLATIVASLSTMKEDDFPGPVAPAQYEKTLEFYAQILRQYCLSFIQGDFSTWTKVLRYHLNWMRSRYGKKLPPEAYSKLEDYIELKENAWGIPPK
jgi:hypothetical protein